jgi:hypothetical protein
LAFASGKTYETRIKAQYPQQKSVEKMGCLKNEQNKLLKLIKKIEL